MAWVVQPDDSLLDRCSKALWFWLCRSQLSLTMGTTLILPSDATSKASDSPGLPLELQSYKTQKRLQIVLQAWAPIPCHLIVNFHCKNVHVFGRKEPSATTQRKFFSPWLRWAAPERLPICFLFCFSHFFFCFKLFSKNPTWKNKFLRRQQDNSVGKDACHQTRQLECVSRRNRTAKGAHGFPQAVPCPPHISWSTYTTHTNK